MRRGAKVQHSIAQKPTPICLDLSNQGLESFDRIYEEIIDFAKTNVKTRYDFSNLDIAEIDLSSNKLTCFLGVDKNAKLFAEYKPLQKLDSVKSLNLLNNLELESIKDCVNQVQALMPNLKGLQISLSLEEDVSFIMAKFPNLENLNGIEVERDQLLESPGSAVGRGPIPEQAEVTNTDREDEPRIDPASQAFDAVGGEIHDDSPDSNVDLNETPARDSRDHGQLRLDRRGQAKDLQESAREIDEEAFEDERSLDQGWDKASTVHIQLHRINEQTEETTSYLKPELCEDAPERGRDSTAYVSVNELNQKLSPRGQGTVFEYNQNNTFNEGPASIYDEELGADAAERKTSKYTEEKVQDVGLDDTRDNVSE